MQPIAGGPLHSANPQEHPSPDPDPRWVTARTQGPPAPQRETTPSAQRKGSCTFLDPAALSCGPHLSRQGLGGTSREVSSMVVSRPPTLLHNGAAVALPAPAGRNSVSGSTVPVIGPHRLRQDGHPSPAAVISQRTPQHWLSCVYAPLTFGGPVGRMGPRREAWLAGPVGR